MRLNDLKSWIIKIYNLDLDINLIPLNSDASFRKYYRFFYNNKSLIAVDSPPTHEKNKEFINIQNILSKNQVNVPEIFNSNLELGYFVLEDFGDQILLPKLISLNNNTKFTEAGILYQNCIDELLKIQSCNISSEAINVPEFNTELLNYEMGLFHEWFISKYLDLKLSLIEHSLLDKVFLLMIENAHAQPKVLVHRDFHSRNLMDIGAIGAIGAIGPMADNNKIGVIDFQDAVIGPLTYDLISLFRDCYISWPIEQVKLWANSYFIKAQNTKELKIISNISFDQYWHWFLLMSLQRNFKTIGIFARLFLRDNKPVYLSDIPRTLNYALEATNVLAKQYKNNDSAAFANMHDLLLDKIKPALDLINNTDKILLND